MTRSGQVAYRLRWLILVAGLLATLTGLSWVFLPALWEGVVEEPAGLIGTPAAVSGELEHRDPFAFVFVGVVLLTQWLFLRPRRGWTLALAERGRPMGLAVFGAAFCAMLLTTGLVATLLEIPDWWVRGVRNLGGMPVVLLPMLGIWVFWILLFFLYWRAGDQYTLLTRMLRALLGGTLLELIVAAPVQAAFHDRDDCYCARGSYTGLVFGGTALVWVFGPGIVLLFLRERARHSRLRRACPECGHDLSGSAARSCPECGAALSHP